MALLTTENLSVKEISARLQISTQSIYKLLQRMKQKNSLVSASLRSDVLSSLPRGLFGDIRLHSQEFNIKVYSRTDRFKRNIGKTFRIDKNTIRIYQHSLEVYSGRSFFGPDAEAAYSQSWEYWRVFFYQLENKLGCYLGGVAGRKIKQVKAHYAEMENELAKKAKKEQAKVSLKGISDNKEWLLIDNSFNLTELETTHPKASLRDMQDAIAPFMQQLRDEPIVLQIIISSIWNINKILEEQGALNTTLTATNHAQQASLKQISDFLKVLTKTRG
jgi:hypothetical protein